MLIGKRIRPAIYRDGMAQTNGDPIEDIQEESWGAGSDAELDMTNINHPAHYTFGTIEVIDAIEGLSA